jgi:4-amino-4-deoxy-L-arabinose transferase-like glycosyltransferase
MTRTVKIAALMSIFGIAARFISIDQAFIDNWSWRQSDVAAIARNYFQAGFHFSRPQIDWAGNEPGYVGTEFPILPFTAALCYKFVGVKEWIGRVLSLIFFALSLPFFFLLVRKMFGEIAAAWALFFYGFAPLGIMASRCFMPDTPSLALSIIGLYFFQCWTEQERSRLFVVSAFCISLSILIKATSIVIAAPLICLLFQHLKIPPFRLGAVFRRFAVWLFAAIALIPSAIWYSHAYQISLQFYPHHFFGAGGVQIMHAAWYSKIAKLLITSTLTPLLFLLGGIGAFITRSQSRWRAFHWWLAAMALFMVIVGYGNRHQWYQLPFVAIFAAFAGGACSSLSAKIANRALTTWLSVLIALSFVASSGFYARGFYQATAAPLRDAGLELKAVAPANALIVASDNGDPTLLYYAERRGWHFMEKDGIYDGEPRDSTQAIADLEQLRKRGGSHLAFTSNTAWWLNYYPEFAQHLAANSMLIATTSEFKIYRLDPMVQ